MTVIFLASLFVSCANAIAFTQPDPLALTSNATREDIESRKKIEQKRSMQFSDPELLFPSQKIASIPVLSKFFFDQNRIIGSNSELNKIVVSSEAQGLRFISPGTVEIEDFTYRNGLFYLLTNKDREAEILVLDMEGKVVSRFPLVQTPPTMTSIAVDSRGYIYHNNPSDPDGIITAYNIRGNVKRVFGLHLPERYFASMKLLNRVVMAVDSGNNLIVAFRFEPIVRKYNSNGDLIFEKEISCKEIIMRIEEEKKRYPERFSLTANNRVKISAFTYFTSVTTDEKNNIYVKLGADSLIFKLNEEGELEKKYFLIMENGSIEDFDFWESSMVISGGTLYYPMAVQGSESFGYILKYKLHE